MLSFIFAVASCVGAAPVSVLQDPVPPAAQAAPSLFDAVAQRMSPQGRPIFRRYVEQVLQSRIRADSDAERQYRVALRALVAAPTLDVDAVERLIAARRQAETTLTTSIRGTAFAMIRTLPAADRKLALTAIFADARMSARPQPGPTPPPAK